MSWHYVGIVAGVALLILAGWAAGVESLFNTLAGSFKVVLVAIVIYFAWLLCRPWLKGWLQR